MSKINIAIDGYSSCGKSTLAKALASKLGYSYVDSGAMYRAVTLFCLNNGIIKKGKFNSEKLIKNLWRIKVGFIYNPSLKFSETFLNDLNVEKEIRSMEVSSFVSGVSAVKEVRKQLISMQKELGKSKGIVMDGRDIGTAVFPDAEIKLFMLADVDVRTQRRLDELLSKGIKVSAEEVKNNLNQRDYEDTHRKENPLVKAKDAIVFDNSDLNQAQQLDYVLKLVKDFGVSVQT